MPNDCTNIVTITCKNTEMLNEFVNNVLKVIEQEHNTEYHNVIDIYKHGKCGIVFHLWSAWAPDIRWFETILENYPEFWIKNEWHEEGGMAGVWIGFMKNDNQKSIESLTWRDLSIEENNEFFKKN